MQISLKTQLSIAMTLISLVSIIIISIIINFFLESQFKDYAVKRQEAKNSEVVSLLRKQYIGGNRWNEVVIENIGISVLEESLILSLRDSSGEIVWDALEYNRGVCHTMIDNMAQRMFSKYPSISGGLTHKEYEIVVDNQLVGIVNIGYYGPFYFTDTEFYFVETVNRSLLVVAIIAVILSLITGYFMAINISSPVASVTRLARNVANGDYHYIKGIRSPTREVHELVKAINHMTETLTRQEKLRKRLTADVAHELRTPLTTLRGELEAMIDGIWVASTERLESCHEEIIRITNLIQDMETLTRYDSENIKLEKSDLNLLELAEKISTHHTSLPGAKGITVTCSGTPLIIHGDKEKISQVILNLFTNAVKFTPEGGSIDMQVKKRNKRALFIIRDSGCGIPQEEQSLIFERFYRVDKSRTRSSGGAGIGLTIAKEIVKAHNGSIDLTSTPGEGTEIRVILPFK